MPDRIAAIVVSYNRLAEIKGAVAALRAQTCRPELLLVVDNGSTDGSSEWLAAQPDVLTLHQSNLGESGGFRRGLNFALDQGFDWCWLFDDDAHPAPDALQALCAAMAHRPDARVFNSVSLARTDPARFAVGALWVRTSPDDYRTGRRLELFSELAAYADANGMVDTIGGHFYQGVLLHRSVVQKVGVPLVWLFGWGDEIEYGLRIMRAGNHIYSVMDSIVYHPAIPFAPLQLFGVTKMFEIRPPHRRYYFIRNAMWIHRTYFAKSPLVPYIARRLGGALLAELFVIPHRSLRERLLACQAALRGVIDGLRLQPARDASGREILA